MTDRLATISEVEDFITSELQLGGCSVSIAKPVNGRQHVVVTAPSHMYAEYKRILMEFVRPLVPTIVDFSVIPEKVEKKGVDIARLVEGMKMHTDLNPWYWAAVGEKCYDFCVFSAFPKKYGDEYPEPGSRLELDDDGDFCGSNGTKMLVEGQIANISDQNGDTVCAFIAGMHAHFLGDSLPKV